MNPIGDGTALKVTPVVFADKNGRGIDETNLFRVYIKGNGLVISPEGVTHLKWCERDYTDNMKAKILEVMELIHKK